MGANGPKMACGSLFPQETAWPRLRKGEWTTCEAARLMSAASVPAGGRRQPNRLRGLAERISQYRPREKVSREKQAFSQEPMHGHQREKSRHLSGISNAACIPFTRASALDGYVLLARMGGKPESLIEPLLALAFKNAPLVVASLSVLAAGAVPNGNNEDPDGHRDGKKCLVVEVRDDLQSADIEAGGLR